MKRLFLLISLLMVGGWSAPLRAQSSGGGGGNGVNSVTCVSGCIASPTTGAVQITVTASGGSVTTFSSGSLSPLFTTSVATATTTPAQTFSLSTAAADTVFGNCTGSTATPSYCALVSAMIPNNAANTTGNAATATALSTTGANGTFWGVSGGVQGYYTPAGGGNVSNSGTPTINQLAIWTNATTIQGVTTLPAANFPTLAGDVTTPGASLTTTVVQIEGAAIPVSATLLGTNSSKQAIAAALASADVFVGNASNLPVAVAISGDVTLANTGAVAVVKVNGLAIPASACMTGTNSSNQFTALTCTGTGNAVLATSPTLVTPNLGTPSTLLLTNATSLPCGALPALTGDTTTSATSCATTTAKINGTAFSGTSGNVVKFGAGNTPADSAILAANLVTASSPGVGLCHFAGSTQACTSSAVVGSDMTNATVTATQLAAQYSKGSCTELWGGSGTSFALTSGDDAISNNSCYNDSGVTRTITAVKCRSDIASNTTTVNPTFGASGTGTTILSGTLTCGSSLAYSSSGTVSNASWTTGSGITPAMGGTLTGTSIAMIVEYTF